MCVSVCFACFLLIWESEGVHMKLKIVSTFSISDFFFRFLTNLCKQLLQQRLSQRKMSQINSMPIWITSLGLWETITIQSSQWTLFRAMCLLLLVFFIFDSISVGNWVSQCATWAYFTIQVYCHKLSQETSRPDFLFVSVVL